MTRGENRAVGSPSLTVSQLTDLTVHLLELLTDLLHRDVVAERFGHLVNHLGGGVARRSDVVTLDTQGRKTDQMMLELLPMLRLNITAVFGARDVLIRSHSFC